MTVRGQLNITKYFVEKTRVRPVFEGWKRRSGEAVVGWVESTRRKFGGQNDTHHLKEKNKHESTKKRKHEN